MIYVKSYNSFKSINESLKSDTIEVVTKKLISFFKKYGLNQKNGWFDDGKNYFQIVSDRDHLKRFIEEKKDPNNYVTIKMIELGYKQDDMIQNAIQDLNDFQYGDICIFCDNNTEKMSRELLHLIETCGYFVSVEMKTKVKDKSKILDTIISLDGLSLMIEPYYDTLVDFKEEFLYHTTDKKYLDKILKYGLSPKSKNTRSFYPERIYLSPNVEYMESIMDQLSGDKPGEYVTLKVRNFEGLTLYKDVRFKGGFYTYNNIHPKNIEVMK